MADKPPKVGAPFIIDAENIGMTSFSDLMCALELARRLRCHIRTKLCGKLVVVDGSEDPHKLYGKLTGEVDAA